MRRYRGWLRRGTGVYDKKGREMRRVHIMMIDDDDDYVMVMKAKLSGQKTNSTVIKKQVAIHTRLKYSPSKYWQQSRSHHLSLCLSVCLSVCPCCFPGNDSTAQYETLRISARPYVRCSYYSYVRLSNIDYMPNIIIVMRLMSSLLTLVRATVG